MDRRAFITTVGASILAVRPVAEAQTPTILRRIGVLSLSSGMVPEGFLHGLREHGWEPGRNVLIESRHGGGRAEQLSERAAELVRLPVDVFLAYGSVDVEAVLRWTRTIPVVTVYVSDPVARGFTTSLARPGRNVTGFTIGGLWEKRLDLLRQILPRLSRVALVWDLGLGPVNTRAVGLNDDTIRRLGLTLHHAPVREIGDIDHAFAGARQAGAGALLLGPDTNFLRQSLPRIAELAIRNRWPGIADRSLYAKGGVLMGYGPDVEELYRGAASYVDRLLRGAHPANLPFQEPTKFELAINLTTPKALALTIPQTLLLQANQVIQ